MNAWAYLLLAGALEVVWALGFKSTHGFTRLWPTVYVFAIMAVSFYCLSQAVKVLPLGTAYAIWTGIGAAGTALVGLFFLGEPFHFLRLVCIFMIITGTVGLKFFP